MGIASATPVATRTGDLTVVALVVCVHHNKRGSLPVIALAARGHCKRGDSPVLAHANYSPDVALAACAVDSPVVALAVEPDAVIETGFADEPGDRTVMFALPSALPEIDRLFHHLVQDDYLVSLAAPDGVKLVFRCAPTMLEK